MLEIALSHLYTHVLSSWKLLNLCPWCIIRYLGYSYVRFIEQSTYFTFDSSQAVRIVIFQISPKVGQVEYML